MNAFRLLLLVAAWGLSAIRIVAQEVPFIETSVAGFTVGESQYKIHPMLRNSTIAPTRWQFRYDPLFLPYVNGNGQIYLEEFERDNDQIVAFKLAIGDPLANDMAYQELRATYPVIAHNLRQGNVGPLMLSEITIGFEQTPLPKNLGSLLTQKVHIAGQLTIRVECKAANPNAVGKLKKWLSTAKLDISYKVQTRTNADRNQITIHWSGLRNSRLYAKLDGLPDYDRKTKQKDVFVHRDDIRDLGEDIYVHVKVKGVIEDPGRFNDDVMQKILKEWQAQERLDLDEYNKKKWDSTFQFRDLTPDSIRKTFEKAIRKTDKMDEYEIDFERLREAGFKWGGLSSNSKRKLKFGKRELQKHFAERQWEVLFEGEKVIPKKIQVQRANLGVFQSNRFLTNTMRYVGKDTFVKKSTFCTLQSVQGKVANDLAARMAALEKRIAALEKRADAAELFRKNVQGLIHLKNNEVVINGKLTVGGGNLLSAHNVKVTRELKLKDPQKAGYIVLYFDGNRPISASYDENGRKWLNLGGTIGGRPGVTVVGSVEAEDLVKKKLEK